MPLVVVKQLVFKNIYSDLQNCKKNLLSVNLISDDIFLIYIIILRTQNKVFKTKKKPYNQKRKHLNFKFNYVNIIFFSSHL